MGISAGIGLLGAEAGFGAGIGFGAIEAGIGAGIAEGIGAASLGGALAGEAALGGAALGFGGAEAAFGFGGAELFGAEFGAEALAGGFGGFEGFGGGAELFGAEFAGETASALGIDSFGGELGSFTGFEGASSDMASLGGDFSASDSFNLENMANGEPTNPYDSGTQDYLKQFESGEMKAPTERDAVDKVYTEEGAQQQPAQQAGRGTGGNAARAGAGNAAGAGAGQMNPGQLLSSLMQMAKMGQKPPSLGGANSAAGALTAQGQMLLDQYNRGELSGPMMAKVRTDLLGNFNKVRQYYKTAGRYNSTDRIQAENLATLQASAAMADALGKELQQGLDALGRGGQLFAQTAQMEMANDRAQQSSLSNALGSILKIPFGGGAGSGGFIPSSTGNSYAQLGGGGGSGGSGGGGGDYYYSGGDYGGGGAESFGDYAA